MLHSQQIRRFDWSLQVFLSRKNSLSFACLKCVSHLLSCHLNQQACQKCTPSYHQRQTRAAIANLKRSMSYYPCDRTNKLPKGDRWHSWRRSSNTVVNASHCIVGELYATVFKCVHPWEITAVPVRPPGRASNNLKTVNPLCLLSARVCPRKKVVPTHRFIA